MEDASLELKAKTLVKSFASGLDPRYGTGSMSCTAYDTAWVSMIGKDCHGTHVWLFPEAFQALLKLQSAEGHWPGHAAIDAILNTAASLLSIQRHLHRSLPKDIPILQERASRAATILGKQLADWDVEATTHVAFEILVPSLLEQLATEGYHFHFKGQEELTQMYHAKMSKFSPDMLYGEHKSTALHSLEALVGQVDFAKLSHHKVDGSMMASPSSTAAYLMENKDWDQDAQSYLQHVVDAGPGRRSGLVPGAFPSTYFELSWILSTLLTGGFSPEDLQCQSFDTLKSVLTDGLSAGGGLIGFAPCMKADADDTAKAVLALSLSGLSIDISNCVKNFESNTHFTTYLNERDPSISTNCNVLLALCHVHDVARYALQIRKLVSFLCRTWEVNQGVIVDKWNTSPSYSIMLLVLAFLRVLELHEQCVLNTLPVELMDELKLIIFRAVSHELKTVKMLSDSNQQVRRSEEIAYSTIALASMLQFSATDLFKPLEDHLLLAVPRTHDRLRVGGPTDNFLWIEKITYQVPFLSEAYTLAALKLSGLARAKPRTTPTFPMSVAGDKLVKRFSGLPLYRSTPERILTAVSMEARVFQSRLKGVRLRIFPREGMAEDKYFDFLPLAWTAANHLNENPASGTFLYEMMVISLLNYQVDEYIESVAGLAFRNDLPALENLVQNLFAAIIQNDPPFRLHGTKHSSHIYHTSNGKTYFLKNQHTTSPPDKGSSTQENPEAHHLETTEISAILEREINSQAPKWNQTSRSDVRECLSNFIHYISAHVAVQNATPHDRAAVLFELRAFLLAHVHQARDSAHLQHTRLAPKTPFASWVHSTSAVHTSCSYSFAFALCLIAHERQKRQQEHRQGTAEDATDCFATADEKYLAHTWSAHLARSCRLYNDYGSVARDAVEGNLNSVNFREFDGRGAATASTQAAAGVGGAESRRLERAKEALPKLAGFERAQMDAPMRLLEEYAGREKEKRHVLRMLEVFCDVTDSFGQIYVVKDIASVMGKMPAEAT